MVGWEDRFRWTETINADKLQDEKKGLTNRIREYEGKARARFYQADEFPRQNTLS